MKKILQKTGRLLLILLCILFMFLLATTIFHHISLVYEAKKIVPNGMLVEVDGHNIHIYAEGEKRNRPTLVFMSGSATVAPVYDFKSLYSMLSAEYRIVVVEKAGYGYAEICEVERDIDTMLNEVRQGLTLAGESGPYVLFPHSMSGLEAVYWAQQYPEEVKAIIGLDMAVPESYEYFDFSSVKQMMYLGRASVWLGLHRIPGVYSLDAAELTEDEIAQQKLLMYRNAVNIDYVLEGKAVYNNAVQVKSGGALNLAILMFVSNGGEIGEYWIPCQKRFAAQNDAQLIHLDCGHYVHNFEHQYIAEKVLAYLTALQ
ncbi:MAG TPA: alpha/beta hydrolase [Oscillospiraceae bacterium]|nr:alpha/beta hydrolase [Oscillospiraceae bacterium]